MAYGGYACVEARQEAIVECVRREAPGVFDAKRRGNIGLIVFGKENCG